MRKTLAPSFALLFALLGCQAPDILLSNPKAVAVRSNDYARLWQACRAVVARQYEILSENEREGRIVARSKSAAMVARPNADPADSRTVSTDVTVFLVPKESGYEVQVRAGTRSAPGPDFTFDKEAGMPQSRQTLSFDSMGNTARRDYNLEERIKSQIQAELNYTPAPKRPKK